MLQFPHVYLPTSHWNRDWCDNHNCILQNTIRQRNSFMVKLANIDRMDSLFAVTNDRYGWIVRVVDVDFGQSFVGNCRWIFHGSLPWFFVEK